jgi:chromosome segregation ATPase
MGLDENNLIVMLADDIKGLREDVRHANTQIREDFLNLRTELSTLRTSVDNKTEQQTKSINEAWNVIRAKEVECKINQEKLDELESACDECKPQLQQAAALSKNIKTMFYSVFGGLIITIVGAVVTISLKACH